MNTMMKMRSKAKSYLTPPLALLQLLLVALFVFADMGGQYNLKVTDSVNGSLPIFSVITICIGNLSGQTLAQNGDEQSRNLSGSHLAIEDSLAKSDTIFVGNVTEISQGTSAKEPGAVTYIIGVDIKKCLRGNATGHVSVALKTYMAYQQKTPSVGSSYVFFVNQVNPDYFRMTKLMPATGDNITKVKALIAAAPPSK